MNKYTFEIEVRDNESGNTWMTTDFAVAENEKQALINVDEDNDRLGYKIIRATIIAVEPFDDDE